MDLNVAVDLGPNTFSLLQKLAAHIGVTTDKIWPWFVKQHVYLEVANIGVALFLLTSGMTAAYLGWKRGKANNFEDGFVLAAMIIGIVITILGLAAAVIAATEFPRLVNPEYYAVQELVGMVSKMIGK